MASWRRPLVVVGVVFTLLLASFTGMLFVPSAFYERADPNLDVTGTVTHNFVDPSLVEAVSLFRSQAGHDYSDGTCDCVSMKHYIVGEDITVFAPFDGRITHVVENGKDDYDIYIQHHEHPQLWVRFFHVDLGPHLRERMAGRLEPSSDIPFGLFSWPQGGIETRAGDPLGTFTSDRGGDISLETTTWTASAPPLCTSKLMRTLPISAFSNSCRNPIRAHSIFNAADDGVLAEWADWGLTPDQVIVEKDTRTIFKPATCSAFSEDFTPKPFPELKATLSELSTTTVEPASEYRIPADVGHVVVLSDDPADISINTHDGRRVGGIRLSAEHTVQVLNTTELSADGSGYVLRAEQPDRRWVVFQPEDPALIERLVGHYLLRDGTVKVGV